MSIVIDASVALSLCFPDEDTEYADAAFRRLGNEVALVPAVWALEVANALLFAERGGRIAGVILARAHATLSGLPVTLAETTLERALGIVTEAALSHNLTTYDASYLELAVREGLPLATQDNRMRAAATTLGVGLV